jgi:hypothetical protein
MGTIITLEPRVYAEDLFDGLRPENEQGPSRKFYVKRSRGLDAIIEGYKKAVSNYRNRVADFYKICKDSLLEGYSSGDITKFSVLFPELQIIKLKLSIGDFFLGNYFSALINHCKEDKPIRLEFGHYERDLWVLGHQNSEKTILIHGDVGLYLGHEMSGGKIIVDGNAKEYVGYKMSGGKIIVDGNAKEYVGYKMSGGEIVVNGDCNYKSIGNTMTGGEMYINGDYESISRSIRGGNIYHKGKLIIKDGKAVEGAKIKWEY